MQVTETLNQGLKREFTVVVPAAAIAEQTDTRLKEVGRTLNIPGFRPGKAPFAMIKQRYGDSVMGEVLEKIVEDSSKHVLSNRGLRSAGLPKVEIVTFEKGGDLKYSLATEVLPEIEPIDFATIKLERLTARPSEEEVERSLKRLSKNFAGTRPLEETRPAVSGDTVVIDFAGKLDGEAFENGSGKDYSLELGSNSFIPGFEEQVVGMSAGETKDIAVTFPKDYPADDLPGKEVIFTVTLKEVRLTEPLAIDDGLAKKLGMNGVAELRNAVREQIERDYAGLSRSKLKRALLDELAKAHDFLIPQTMAEREFNAIWSQIEDAKKEGQIDLKHAGKSEDALKAEFRAIADRRVRLGLLLMDVGHKENVHIGEEELRREIVAQARRYPGQEQQVIKYFLKTPAAVERLRVPVYEEKVVDRILQMVAVTDKAVTPEELLRETGEGEGAA